MAKDKHYTKWECPFCGFKYTNPIPCLAVSHRCPERNEDTRQLKPVGDPE